VPDFPVFALKFMPSQAVLSAGSQANSVEVKAAFWFAVKLELANAAASAGT